MARIIAFVIEIKSISESGSKELVNNLFERENIDDVGEIDTDKFEYSVRYDGIPHVLTHSEENSILTTSTTFWEENQRPRDQWLGGGTVDGMINFLQHFSDFRDIIQTATDKRVVAEPRERRS